MSLNETRTNPKENGRRRADPLIVAALARGWTDEEAARAAGVSKETVKRRRKEPEFNKLVTEARNETVERLQDVVLSACVAAVEILTKLAGDAESETVRLGAARALLGQANLGRKHVYTGIRPMNLSELYGSRPSRLQRDD